MDPDPDPYPYWPPSGSGSVKNEYGSETLGNVAIFTKNFPFLFVFKVRIRSGFIQFEKL